MNVAHTTWDILDAQPAPIAKVPLHARLRKAFFPNVLQGLMSIVILGLLAWLAPGLVDWALLSAVWDNSDPSLCRADGAGACWAVVVEKHRVMLFGTFPFDQHWRAGLASALIVAASVMTAVPAIWRVRVLIPLWICVVVLVMWLMLGGFGLPALSTSDWGGLPLTLIIFAGTFVLGLPLALGLALGRQSDMPVFRYVSIGIIEVFRGLPLLVVLFMASLLLPLFLGDSVTIDKFIRAQLGMVLFFAAYASEIIRGGLQAIPKGQYEGAQSLGLGYWGMMIMIILPQALRIVVPALVNDIIRAFKNTSFLAVVGLFDFLGSTRASLEDPAWVKFSVESYVFIIIVYFAFCMAMSRYSLWIEARINKDREAV